MSATLRHPGHDVATLLKSFRLSTAAEQMVRRLEQAGCDDAIEIVREVLDAEREVRWQRRVNRLLYRSKLPRDKTFEAWQSDTMPLPLTRQLRELADGKFLDDAINLLAFGLPGTGKTHAMCALGHELVRQGRSVYFVPTFRLVQQLLIAKRELELPRLLKKLDRFDLLIPDDIGYVKQEADEIEVLFTLLAERYERRSVAITSNLTFGDWDQIFRNPMTTAAAIDRLVHHSAILEFNVPSYRMEHRRSVDEQGQIQP